ncbi:MAG: flagellar filament outer layer protein FlaA [Treponema sp.]|jgi:hypothetical protein|nr:flagellar filament outer layer protein FlaA [Treponema sp.]
MKHGSFKIICLIVWACITVLSGYGDEITNNFETKILESFDGDSGYTWKVEASKFATKSGDTKYPLLTYVEAWPIAAFGNNRGENARDIKSLGLHGKFDRRGYNWIDLYPVNPDDSDGNPAEIRIPGRVRNLDLWVWGSNLNYYIEVFLRDYQGVIHTLRLGEIGYTGWRNLRVNIPGSIPQSKRILPAYAGLTFVKFRIWTQPAERVDNFFIYFKQLKVLTDVFESLYDGNDLADPQNVDKIWANSN